MYNDHPSSRRTNLVADKLRANAEFIYLFIFIGVKLKPRGEVPLRRGQINLTHNNETGKIKGGIIKAGRDVEQEEKGAVDKRGVADKFP